MAMPRRLDPDVGALRQVLGTLAQTPWVQFVTTSELQQQAAAQDGGQHREGFVGRVRRASGRRRPAEPDHRAAADDRRDREPREQRRRVQDPAVDDARPATVGALAGEPGERDRLDGLVSEAASAATRGISVASQTTNFLADEGTLQVTVVNDLGVAVDGATAARPHEPAAADRQPARPDPDRRGQQGRGAGPGGGARGRAGPDQRDVGHPDGTPIGVPGTILVRANPPGYTFYIVGGAIVALILVFGIVRSLRRSRTGRARTADVAAPPVLPPSTRGARGLRGTRRSRPQSPPCRRTRRWPRPRLHRVRTRRPVG